MALDLCTMVVRWIAAAALAAAWAHAEEPLRFMERKLNRRVAGCKVEFRWLELPSGTAEVRNRINSAIAAAFFNGTQKPDFGKEADDFINDCREEAPHRVAWSLIIGMKTLRTQPVVSLAYGSESYAGG